MLRAALAFFALALVAAVFGFGGVATSAIGIGKLLFYGFALVAAVTLLLSFVRRR